MIDKILSRVPGAWRDYHIWVTLGMFTIVTLLHYLVGYGDPGTELSPDGYGLTRHAIDRILFLLPITYAGYYFRLRWGIVALAVAAVAMLPRAIVVSPTPTNALVETGAIILVGALLILVQEGYHRQTKWRQEAITRLEIADTEHIEAEKELRESEEKYRALVNHMGDGYMVFRDRKVVFANQRCAEIMDVPLQKLIGEDFWKYIALEDLGQAVQIREAFIEGGDTPQLQEFVSIGGESGRRVPLEISVREITYEGELSYAVVLRDITERKRAEEALRESEELYRAIFETAPTSIILTDRDGQIIDVSTYHISNVARGKINKEDLVGENIAMHPTIVNAGLSETYQEVLRGEPFERKDVYFPTMSAGTDGFFNVKGAPLFRDGKVIGAVIMHEDITERKRAENALQERQKQLEIRTNQVLALHKVTTSLQSTADLTRMLQQIVEAVVVNLGYDHSFMMLVDEKAEVIRGAVFFSKGGPALISDLAQAMGRELTQLEHPNVRGYSPAFDDALNGKANTMHSLCAIGEPMLTKEQCNAVQELLGARTIVTIPMIARGRLIGTITAFTGHEQITEVDLETLWILANQSGIAIENNYFYQLEKRLRENLSFYLRQVTTAQEEERKRIARELHDDTAQELVALSRRLDKLLSVSSQLSSRESKQLDEAHQHVDRILEGVRRFSRDLRPSILDDLGLLPALEWLASELTNQFGIAIGTAVVGTERRFTPEAELLMFRIAQEALRNTCRHADASRAWITVEFDDGKTVMRITDNGRGFDLPENTSDLASLGKLGLAGMEERAKLLGGSLSMHSEKGTGTTVTVEVPI